MFFRSFFEAFAKQRPWSRMSRLRYCRYINSFTRTGIGITKYPRSALLLSFTGVYNASHNKHNTNGQCSVDDVYLQYLCQATKHPVDKLEAEVTFYPDLAKELVELERLKNATLICKQCTRRLLIDKQLEGKVYCKCDKNGAVVDECTGWQPFLESKDIIIWRREENPGSGLYEYKVYGRYEEVTAEDFLTMHTDLVYWTSWDDTALCVKRLPQPPTCAQRQNQEIIYWETLWPRLFSNRDYVYVRRHAYMDVDEKDVPINVSLTYDISQDATQRLPKQNDSKPLKNRHSDDDYGHKIEKHDHNNPENVRNALEIGSFMNSNMFQNKMSNTKLEKKKIIVLTSQSCEHPDAPETHSAYRVARYRSDLVIKPFTNVDKPGIEFSLTYFDDPGMIIPTALQSWVAGHACPDFLLKMRLAAGNYKKATEVSKNEKTLEKTVISTKNTSLEESSLMDEVLSSPNPQQDQPMETKENNDPLSPESNIQQAADSPEEIRARKEQMYKEKTKRDTEQFLNLLNGNPKGANVKQETSTGESSHKMGDKTRNEDEMKRKESGKKEDKGGHGKKEGQEHQEISSYDKHEKKDQQSTSYWHIWPLYYFA